MTTDKKMQSFRMSRASREKLTMISLFLFTRGLISGNKFTKAIEYLIENFKLDD